MVDSLKREIGRAVRSLARSPGFTPAVLVSASIFDVLRLRPMLGSVLHGVSPTDPNTLIVVSVIMLLIAVLASYVPAQRAMSVDPAEALRAD